MKPLGKKGFILGTVVVWVLTMLVSCSTYEKYPIIDVLDFSDEDIDVYAMRTESLDQARQWGDSNFSGASPVHSLASQDKTADYAVGNGTIVRHFRYSDSSDGAYIVIGVLKLSGISSYAIFRNTRVSYSALEQGDPYFAYLSVSLETGVVPYHETSGTDKTTDVLVEYK